MRVPVVGHSKTIARIARKIIMATKKARTRQHRRDRRKAKQSKYRRAPKTNSKFGHNGSTFK